MFCVCVARGEVQNYCIFLSLVLIKQHTNTQASTRIRLTDTTARALGLTDTTAKQAKSFQLPRVPGLLR